MSDSDRLGAFQQHFSHFLLQREAVHAADLAPWLDPDDPGLQVYRNNVWHGLQESLAALYPAVRSLVGPAFFNALARDYIAQAPPLSPVLTFYGHEFPAFINRHEACASLAWLGDVAALEWHCHAALHAGDAALLDPRELARSGEDTLSELNLVLHPSARLTRSRWPVHLIREQALSDNPRQVRSDTGTLACLLIHRPEDQVRIVELQGAAYSLLSSLQSGLSLAAGWEAVRDEFGTDDAELIPMLSYLLRLDVFSACRQAGQQSQGE